ncbi:MAG TPA: NAD(P)-dependent oxidoreductase [Candidatus Saccharimonadales bacterium]|nr:NAD(P)-dependent oxidoreductase [Candidatus Saccharimonadales bacterium]
MKIVLPDKISISDKYKNKIRELGAEIFDDLPDETELIKRIREAEIITASYVNITSSVMDAAPNLKYVIVPTVGYELVDTKYAATKGITTLNCPTFSSQAVAEYAITLLMAANRNLITGIDKLRSGEWNPQALTGHELGGKNLGLVGYGNIGIRIDKMASTLGMQVDHVNSKSTSDEIDTLVANSDFLIICAPLNDETRNLIDERRLKLLKPTAILVNVGRGAVVDQNTLIDLLKNQKIRGAGLDVFDGEPSTGKPSETIVEISKLPNVVATPHIAYNAEEINDRRDLEILANIQSCIAGEPINVVMHDDVQTIE